MEERFIKGVELFNARSFFEAHDTWEELWRETRGDHRLFYQGLIQTAVGLYHLLNANCRGACSQFEKALSKLGHYIPAHHGINTSELVREVRECLNDAELLCRGEISRFDQTKIPRILLDEVLLSSKAKE